LNACGPQLFPALKKIPRGIELTLIGAVLTDIDAGQGQESFILIVREGQAGGDGLSPVLGRLSGLKLL
jgi:hypothetical protein